MLVLRLRNKNTKGKSLMSSANQAPLKSSYILSYNLLTSFLEPVSCPSHSYCSFHSISQFNQELPMWEIPQMFHWSSHKWDLSDLGCFEKISDVLNDCVINLWKSILKLFSSEIPSPPPLQLEAPGKALTHSGYQNFSAWDSAPSSLAVSFLPVSSNLQSLKNFCCLFY